MPGGDRAVNGRRNQRARQLTVELGTSRTTVRPALSELVGEERLVGSWYRGDRYTFVARLSAP